MSRMITRFKVKCLKLIALRHGALGAGCFADPDSGAAAAVCYEPPQVSPYFISAARRRQLLNLLPDTVRRKLSLALQSLRAPSAPRPTTACTRPKQRQLLTRPLLTQAPNFVTKKMSLKMTAAFFRFLKWIDGTGREFALWGY
jgi:hypothetical protein